MEEPQEPAPSSGGTPSEPDETLAEDRGDGAPETWRLFVALLLPDAFLAASADVVERLSSFAPAVDWAGERRSGGGRRSRRRSAIGRVRWVRRDQLHLTLVFLGEQPAERVEAVCREIGEVASSGAPVPVRAVPRLGRFPKRGRARVLWLGLQDTDAESSLENRRSREERGRAVRSLERLQEELVSRLARVLDDHGVRDEREFRPHLTLARCRAPLPGRVVERLGEVAAQELQRVAEVSCTLQRLALVRSHLEPDGARYEVLCDALLGSGSTSPVPPRARGGTILESAGPASDADRTPAKAREATGRRYRDRGRADDTEDRRR